MVVFTCMYDRNGAQSLASSRTRRWMDGRKAQSQCFVKCPDGSEKI